MTNSGLLRLGAAILGASLEWVFAVFVLASFGSWLGERLWSQSTSVAIVGGILGFITGGVRWVSVLKRIQAGTPK